MPSSHSLMAAHFLACFRTDREPLGCRRIDHEPLGLCKDGGGHRHRRAAGRERASPVSEGGPAAGREAAGLRAGGPARAVGDAQQAPLDRAGSHRRTRIDAGEGGPPALVAPGAWCRSASSASVGPPTPVQVGAVPTASMRAPSRARAARGTRDQSPRRACTPPARAATSGRRGADAPPPGGEGTPLGMLQSSRVLRAPRRAVRTPQPKEAHLQGRGPQGRGQGDPAAEEEEPTPDQAEAGAPEPPHAVIPSAPVVQEGHNRVEGE